MTKQTINTGTLPNDGTGDTLKTSFTKTNSNFSELYSGRISGIAVQVFATAGTATYTPTAGMMSCLIEVIGGGGGGGSTGDSTGIALAAGGGGGGGYSRALKTAAQVGASQNVRVGAAGIGVLAANGNAGGDSYVGAALAGSLCGAKGGAGGGFCGSGGLSAGGAGGAGASGVGDISASGSPGGQGFFGDATVYMGSGHGGSSAFGGGGVGQPAVGPVAGIAGGAYGGGGGGAASYASATQAKGGDGRAGVVIITEYLAV